MAGGPPDVVAAIDGAVFARLMSPFDPFETAPLLAVAVSGGRDSLALALLADEWARARGGRIVALIVDHGLRPESSGEARGTAATLAGHGIAAEILAWSGPKPTSRLQEAARAARYDLLRAACRRIGALHLLVAHHADDQSETVAMRAARHSGPDGLAGMAALVETAEVRLLRPLLGVRRDALTATLVARGVAWVEDPSNRDPRFERVRLRGSGVPAAVPDDGGRARRERQLAEAALDVLEIDPLGGVALDQAAFRRLSPAMGGRLLSRVVQAVSGGNHPPRRDRLARAVERLCAAGSRPRSGRECDFTLAQCKLLLRLAPDRLRAVWIVRPERGRKDPRNTAQPLVPAAFFACGASPASHLE